MIAVASQEEEEREGGEQEREREGKLHRQVIGTRNVHILGNLASPLLSMHEQP